MISCFSNFKSINLEPDSIITVNTDRLSTTSFKGNVCVRPIKRYVYNVLCKCLLSLNQIKKPFLQKEIFLN